MASLAQFYLQVKQKKGLIPEKRREMRLRRILFGL
jgi:hypothetical protein